LSPPDIDRFASQPLPGIGSYLSGISRFATLGGVAMSTYLRDVGWASVVNGVIGISDLGMQVLEASRDDAALESRLDEPLEIIVRPDDPFSYVQLLREIGKLDDVLVVDPYLPSADLEMLVKYPNVKRVLTVDTDVAGERKAVRRTNLANILGAVGGRVELRMDKSRPKKVHDRLVLPRRGFALTMGASLGAFQTTALVRLSEPTSDLLRPNYEAIWRDAEHLDPTALPRVDFNLPASASESGEG
jgi:hypothetical protein